MKVGDLVKMTAGEAASDWGLGFVTSLDTYPRDNLIDIHWFRWGHRSHIEESLEVISESR
jgi:hypothetical protein